LSLLELLGNLRSNSVHIGGSLLGQSLSVDGVGAIIVFEGNLSNETSLLQFDEAVSDALSSGNSGSFGAGSVSLFLTVVLSESVDSNGTSHVELVCDGGSSNVKPVGIIWSKILVTGGLIVIGPL